MVYIVHGKLSRIYSSGWSCSNHLIWEWQPLLNLNNSQFIMSVVNHNKFFFVIELLSGTILDQGVRQGCLKDEVTFNFSKHITQLFRWTVSLLKIWVKEFHVQTDITLCCSNEQLNLLVAHEDNNISGNYEQFCKQLIQHVFHSILLHNLANSIRLFLVSWFLFSQRAQTALNDRIHSNSSGQNSTIHFCVDISPVKGIGQSFYNMPSAGIDGHLLGFNDTYY